SLSQGFFLRSSAHFIQLARRLALLLISLHGWASRRLSHVKLMMTTTCLGHLTSQRGTLHVTVMTHLGRRRALFLRHTLQRCSTESLRTERRNSNRAERSHQ